MIDDILASPSITKKEKAQLLKDDYHQWRLKKLETKGTFFPVFSEFIELLKELTPGAVTMYLYLGLKSSNMEGESFYDIPKMAEALNRSPRTISTWLKELETKGLIQRYQLKPNGVAKTFMRPLPQKQDETPLKK